MCKLLMIDDNPLEHLIVEKMLTNNKLFPNASHSLEGRLIIEYLKTHFSDVEQLPDVIFLDLHMPEFSGWDFINNFEKIYPELKKPIDIYIASSSVNELDMQRSKEYPFVKDYLCKPLKKQTLVDLYSFYQSASGIAS
ncbi:MAG: CheY chemotaxis protein or a CheY-like (receiver) domain [Mucilaginibacter sp.]|jgi:CheY-like chemotaxis protein|nr:CheY chemotaxis protein or a CheY-like (receiver) domain [Mucilaginibacter sp.]